MGYNKNQFTKVNDKKVLHKVRKQWVTVSVAMLGLLGLGAVSYGTVTNASADDNQQPKTTLEARITKNLNKEQSQGNKQAAENAKQQARSLVNNPHQIEGQAKLLHAHIMRLGNMQSANLHRTANGRRASHKHVNANSDNDETNSDNSESTKQISLDKLNLSGVKVGTESPSPINYPDNEITVKVPMPTNKGKVDWITLAGQPNTTFVAPNGQSYFLTESGNGTDDSSSLIDDDNHFTGTHIFKPGPYKGQPALEDTELTSYFNNRNYKNNIPSIVVPKSKQPYNIDSGINVNVIPNKVTGKSDYGYLGKISKKSSITGETVKGMPGDIVEIPFSKINVNGHHLDSDSSQNDYLRNYNVGRVGSNNYLLVQLGNPGENNKNGKYQFLINGTINLRYEPTTLRFVYQLMQANDNGTLSDVKRNGNPVEYTSYDHPVTGVESTPISDITNHNILTKTMSENRLDPSDYTLINGQSSAYTFGSPINQNGNESSKSSKDYIPYDKLQIIDTLNTAAPRPLNFIIAPESDSNDQILKSLKKSRDNGTIAKLATYVLGPNNNGNIPLSPDLNSWGANLNQVATTWFNNYRSNVPGEKDSLDSTSLDSYENDNKNSKEFTFKEDKQGQPSWGLQGFPAKNLIYINSGSHPGLYPVVRYIQKKTRPYDLNYIIAPENQKLSNLSDQLKDSKSGVSQGSVKVLGTTTLSNHLKEDNTASYRKMQNYVNDVIKNRDGLNNTDALVPSTLRDAGNDEYTVDNANNINWDLTPHAHTNGSDDEWATLNGHSVPVIRYDVTNYSDKQLPFVVAPSTASNKNISDALKGSKTFQSDPVVQLSAHLKAIASSTNPDNPSDSSYNNAQSNVQTAINDNPTVSNLVQNINKEINGSTVNKRRSDAVVPENGITFADNKGTVNWDGTTTSINGHKVPVIRYKVNYTVSGNLPVLVASDTSNNNGLQADVNKGGSDLNYIPVKNASGDTLNNGVLDNAISSILNKYVKDYNYRNTNYHIHGEQTPTNTSYSVGGYKDFPIKWNPLQNDQTSNNNHQSNLVTLNVNGIDRPVLILRYFKQELSTKPLKFIIAPAYVNSNYIKDHLNDSSDAVQEHSDSFKGYEGDSDDSAYNGSVKDYNNFVNRWRRKVGNETDKLALETAESPTFKIDSKGNFAWNSDKDGNYASADGTTNFVSDGKGQKVPVIRYVPNYQDKLNYYVAPAFMPDGNIPGSNSTVSNQSVSLGGDSVNNTNKGPLNYQVSSSTSFSTYKNNINSFVNSFNDHSKHPSDVSPKTQISPNSDMQIIVSYHVDTNSENTPQYKVSESDSKHVNWNLDSDTHYVVKGDKNYVNNEPVIRYYKQYNIVITDHKTHKQKPNQPKPIHQSSDSDDNKWNRHDSDRHNNDHDNDHNNNRPKKPSDIIPNSHTHKYTRTSMNFIIASDAANSNSIFNAISKTNGTGNNAIEGNSDIAQLSSHFFGNGVRTSNGYYPVKYDPSTGKFVRQTGFKAASDSFNLQSDNPDLHPFKNELFNKDFKTVLSDWMQVHKPDQTGLPLKDNAGNTIGSYNIHYQIEPQTFSDPTYTFNPDGSFKWNLDRSKSLDNKLSDMYNGKMPIIRYQTVYTFNFKLPVKIASDKGTNYSDGYVNAQLSDVSDDPTNNNVPKGQRSKLNQLLNGQLKPTYSDGNNQSTNGPVYNSNSSKNKSDPNHDNTLDDPHNNSDVDNLKGSNYSSFDNRGPISTDTIKLVKNNSGNFSSINWESHHNNLIKSDTLQPDNSRNWNNNEPVFRFTSYYLNKYPVILRDQNGNQSYAYIMGGEKRPAGQTYNNVNSDGQYFTNKADFNVFSNSDWNKNIPNDPSDMIIVSNPYTSDNSRYKVNPFSVNQMRFQNNSNNIGTWINNNGLNPTYANSSDRKNAPSDWKNVFGSDNNVPILYYYTRQHTNVSIPSPVIGSDYQTQNYTPVNMENNGSGNNFAFSYIPINQTSNGKANVISLKYNDNGLGQHSNLTNNTFTFNSVPLISEIPSSDFDINGVQYDPDESDNHNVNNPNLKVTVNPQMNNGKFNLNANAQWSDNSPYNSSYNSVNGLHDPQNAGGGTPNWYQDQNGEHPIIRYIPKVTQYFRVWVGSDVQKSDYAPIEIKYTGNARSSHQIPLSDIWDNVYDTYHLSDSKNSVSDTGLNVSSYDQNASFDPKGTGLTFKFSDEPLADIAKNMPTTANSSVYEIGQGLSGAYDNPKSFKISYDNGGSASKDVNSFKTPYWYTPNNSSTANGTTAGPVLRYSNMVTVTLPVALRPEPIEYDQNGKPVTQGYPKMFSDGQNVKPVMIADLRFKLPTRYENGTKITDSDMNVDYLLSHVQDFQVIFNNSKANLESYIRNLIINEPPQGLAYLNDFVLNQLKQNPDILSGLVNGVVKGLNSLTPNTAKDLRNNVIDTLKDPNAQNTIKGMERQFLGIVKTDPSILNGLSNIATTGSNVLNDLKVIVSPSTTNREVSQALDRLNNTILLDLKTNPNLLIGMGDTLVRSINSLKSDPSQYNQLVAAVKNVLSATNNASLASLENQALGLLSSNPQFIKGLVNVLSANPTGLNSLNQDLFNHINNDPSLVISLGKNLIKAVKSLDPNDYSHLSENLANALANNPNAVSRLENTLMTTLDSNQSNVKTLLSDLQKRPKALASLNKTLSKDIYRHPKPVLRLGIYILDAIRTLRMDNPKEYKTVMSGIEGSLKSTAATNDLNGIQADVKKIIISGLNENDHDAGYQHNLVYYLKQYPSLLIQLGTDAVTELNRFQRNYPNDYKTLNNRIIADIGKKSNDINSLIKNGLGILSRDPDLVSDVVSVLGSKPQAFVGFSNTLLKAIKADPKDTQKLVVDNLVALQSAAPKYRHQIGNDIAQVSDADLSLITRGIVGFLNNDPHLASKITGLLKNNTNNIQSILDLLQNDVNEDIQKRPGAWIKAGQFTLQALNNAPSSQVQTVVNDVNNALPTIKENREESGDVKGIISNAFEALANERAQHQNVHRATISGLVNSVIKTVSDNSSRMNTLFNDVVSQVKSHDNKPVKELLTGVTSELHSSSNSINQFEYRALLKLLTNPNSVSAASLKSNLQSLENTNRGTSDTSVQATQHLSDVVFNVLNHHRDIVNGLIPTALQISKSDPQLFVDVGTNVLNVLSDLHSHGAPEFGTIQSELKNLVSISANQGPIKSIKTDVVNLLNTDSPDTNKITYDINNVIGAKPAAWDHFVKDMLSFVKSDPSLFTKLFTTVVRNTGSDTIKNLATGIDRVLNNPKNATNLNDIQQGITNILTKNHDQFLKDVLNVIQSSKPSKRGVVLQDYANDLKNNPQLFIELGTNVIKALNMIQGSNDNTFATVSSDIGDAVNDPNNRKAVSGIGSALNDLISTIGPDITSSTQNDINPLIDLTKDLLKDVKTSETFEKPGKKGMFGNFESDIYHVFTQNPKIVGDFESHVMDLLQKNPNVVPTIVNSLESNHGYALNIINDAVNHDLQANSNKSNLNLLLRLSYDALDAAGALQHADPQTFNDLKKVFANAVAPGGKLITNNSDFRNIITGTLSANPQIINEFIKALRSNPTALNNLNSTVVNDLRNNPGLLLELATDGINALNDLKSRDPASFSELQTNVFNLLSNPDNQALIKGLEVNVINSFAHDSRNQAFINNLINNINSGSSILTTLKNDLANVVNSSSSELDANLTALNQAFITAMQKDPNAISALNVMILNTLKSNPTLSKKLENSVLDNLSQNPTIVDNIENDFRRVITDKNDSSALDVMLNSILGVLKNNVSNAINFTKQIYGQEVDVNSILKGALTAYVDNDFKYPGVNNVNASDTINSRSDMSFSNNGYWDPTTTSGKYRIWLRTHQGGLKSDDLPEWTTQDGSNNINKNNKPIPIIYYLPRYNPQISEIDHYWTPKYNMSQNQLARILNAQKNGEDASLMKQLYSDSKLTSDERKSDYSNDLNSDTNGGHPLESTKSDNGLIDYLVTNRNLDQEGKVVHSSYLNDANSDRTREPWLYVRGQGQTNAYLNAMGHNLPQIGLIGDIVPLYDNVKDPSDFDLVELGPNGIPRILKPQNDPDQPGLQDQNPSNQSNKESFTLDPTHIFPYPSDGSSYLSTNLYGDTGLDYASYLMHSGNNIANSSSDLPFWNATVTLASGKTEKLNGITRQHLFYPTYLNDRGQYSQSVNPLFLTVNYQGSQYEFPCPYIGGHYYTPSVNTNNGKPVADYSDGKLAMVQENDVNADVQKGEKSSSHPNNSDRYFITHNHMTKLKNYTIKFINATSKINPNGLPDSVPVTKTQVIAPEGVTFHYVPSDMTCDPHSNNFNLTPVAQHHDPVVYETNALGQSFPVASLDPSLKNAQGQKNSSLFFKLNINPNKFVNNSDWEVDGMDDTYNNGQGLARQSQKYIRNDNGQGRLVHLPQNISASKYSWHTNDQFTFDPNDPKDDENNGDNGNYYNSPGNVTNVENAANGNTPDYLHHLQWNSNFTFGPSYLDKDARNSNPVNGEETNEIPLYVHPNRSKEVRINIDYVNIGDNDIVGKYPTDVLNPRDVKNFNILNYIPAFDAANGDYEIGDGDLGYLHLSDKTEQEPLKSKPFRYVLSGISPHYYEGASSLTGYIFLSQYSPSDMPYHNLGMNVKYVDADTGQPIDTNYNDNDSRNGNGQPLSDYVIDNNQHPSDAFYHQLDNGSRHVNDNPYVLEDSSDIVTKSDVNNNSDYVIENASGKIVYNYSQNHRIPEYMVDHNGLKHPVMLQNPSGTNPPTQQEAADGTWYRPFKITPTGENQSDWARTLPSLNRALGLDNNPSDQNADSDENSNDAVLSHLTALKNAQWTPVNVSYYQYNYDSSDNISDDDSTEPDKVVENTPFFNNAGFPIGMTVNGPFGQKIDGNQLKEVDGHLVYNGNGSAFLRDQVVIALRHAPIKHEIQFFDEDNFNDETTNDQSDNVHGHLLPLNWDIKLSDTSDNTINHEINSDMKKLTNAGLEFDFVNSNHDKHGSANNTDSDTDSNNDKITLSDLGHSSYIIFLKHHQNTTQYDPITFTRKVYARFIRGNGSDITQKSALPTTPDNYQSITPIRPSWFNSGKSNLYQVPWFNNGKSDTYGYYGPTFTNDLYNGDENGLNPNGQPNTDNGHRSDEIEDTSDKAVSLLPNRGFIDYGQLTGGNPSPTTSPNAIIPGFTSPDVSISSIRYYSWGAHGERNDPLINVMIPFVTNPGDSDNTGNKNDSSYMQDKYNAVQVASTPDAEMYMIPAIVPTNDTTDNSPKMTVNPFITNDNWDPNINLSQLEDEVSNLANVENSNPGQAIYDYDQIVGKPNHKNRDGQIPPAGLNKRLYQVITYSLPRTDQNKIQFVYQKDGYTHKLGSTITNNELNPIHLNSDYVRQYQRSGTLPNGVKFVEAKDGNGNTVNSDVLNAYTNGETYTVYLTSPDIHIHYRWDSVNDGHQKGTRNNNSDVTKQISNDPTLDIKGLGTSDTNGHLMFNSGATPEGTSFGDQHLNRYMGKQAIHAIEAYLNAKVNVSSFYLVKKWSTDSQNVYIYLHRENKPIVKPKYSFENRVQFVYQKDGYSHNIGRQFTITVPDSAQNKQATVSYGGGNPYAPISASGTSVRLYGNNDRSSFMNAAINELKQQGLYNSNYQYVYTDPSLDHQRIEIKDNKGDLLNSDIDQIGFDTRDEVYKIYVTSPNIHVHYRWDNVSDGHSNHYPNQSAFDGKPFDISSEHSHIKSDQTYDINGLLRPSDSDGYLVLDNNGKIINGTSFGESGISPYTSDEVINRIAHKLGQYVTVQSYSSVPNWAANSQDVYIYLINRPNDNHVVPNSDKPSDNPQPNNPNKVLRNYVQFNYRKNGVTYKIGSPFEISNGENQPEDVNISDHGSFYKEIMNDFKSLGLFNESDGQYYLGATGPNGNTVTSDALNNSTNGQTYNVYVTSPDIRVHYRWDNINDGHISGIKNDNGSDIKNSSDSLDIPGLGHPIETNGHLILDSNGRYLGTTPFDISDISDVSKDRISDIAKKLHRNVYITGWYSAPGWYTTPQNVYVYLRYKASNTNPSTVKPQNYVQFYYVKNGVVKNGVPTPMQWMGTYINHQSSLRISDDNNDNSDFYQNVLKKAFNHGYQYVKATDENGKLVHFDDLSLNTIDKTYKVYLTSPNIRVHYRWDSTNDHHVSGMKTSDSDSKILNNSDLDIPTIGAQTDSDGGLILNSDNGTYKDATPFKISDYTNPQKINEIGQKLDKHVELFGYYAVKKWSYNHQDVYIYLKAVSPNHKPSDNRHNPSDNTPITPTPHPTPTPQPKPKPTPKPVLRPVQQPSDNPGPNHNPSDSKPITPTPQPASKPTQNPNVNPTPKGHQNGGAEIIYRDKKSHKIIGVISIHGHNGKRIDYHHFDNLIPKPYRFGGYGYHDVVVKNGDKDIIYVVPNNLPKTHYRIGYHHLYVYHGPKMVRKINLNQRTLIHNSSSHELPQTNEFNVHTSLWAAIMAGISVTMASLGRLVDDVKHRK